MDFRSGSVVRVDRLRSRLESRLPSFIKGRLAMELERFFRQTGGMLKFVRHVDAFQDRLYRALIGEYGDESFCKLVALKVSNLAVAKYHFLRRHAVLTSQPVQLTVDPANACQLACPACVHTSNRQYAALFDWPRNSLPVGAYERFLDEVGLFAFCVMLYNYGEPLLHPRFTDFVRVSKKYLLFTMTSTNLSMPLDNPEDLVMSGLDRMVLSIDGTTQDVYRQYRRKGDLALVVNNVRKLVASKRKFKSPTPYLTWQFLTFQHNVHQTNDAIRMARELGVNEILVQTPFEVDLDEPEIRPVKVRTSGRHIFERWDGQWCSSTARRATAERSDWIARQFDTSWEQRFHTEPHGDHEKSHAASPVCEWLYQNMTLDGAGRIMPCCMAPDKNDKRLVFAHLEKMGDRNRNLVNSSMARLARLAFGDRAAYDVESAKVALQQRPFCAQCQEKPVPYGLANVAADIRALDEKMVIPRSLNWALTHWA